jgi:hypothetical protein
MDEFALIFGLALAALAYLNPDWEKHEDWANLHVLAVAVGLTIFSLYILKRLL